MRRNRAETAAFHATRDAAFSLVPRFTPRRTLTPFWGDGIGQAVDALSPLSDFTAFIRNETGEPEVHQLTHTHACTHADTPTNALTHVRSHTPTRAHTHARTHTHAHAHTA
jgi:hypothetical protein